MYPIRGIPRRIEPGILVYHAHRPVRIRTRLGINHLRPRRNIVVQLLHLGITTRAVRRLHGQDLRHEHAHERVDGAGLVDENRVGLQDLGGGAVLPDVVGAEVHEDDIDGAAGGSNLRVAKPGLEEGLPLRRGKGKGVREGHGFGGDAGREKAAVSLVREVVGGAIPAVSAR